MNFDWNQFLPCNAIGTPNPQAYAHMRETWAGMRGPRGAAFAASVLMLLQDSRLEMANHYTADTSPWSMFDEYGIPGKLYYAFLAFNQLTKTPNRVAVAYDGARLPDVTFCAGLSDDRKTASMLISNFGSAQSSLVVNWQNLPVSGPASRDSGGRCHPRLYTNQPRNLGLGQAAVDAEHSRQRGVFGSTSSRCKMISQRR